MAKEKHTRPEPTPQYSVLDARWHDGRAREAMRCGSSTARQGRSLMVFRIVESQFRGSWETGKGGKETLIRRLDAMAVDSLEAKD
ncbi:hypothetical protein MMC10_010040 [Thelotrema lepadinum]|nr:hypothetical protein [Thelotrema lepadinum]